MNYILNSPARTLAISRTWVVLIAIILCVGFVVRVASLPLMLFDLDEGVASIYALQLVERGDFPLVGVKTSIGFYNPPAFIYLIAPAFIISKSPLLAVALLQAVNVAAFFCVAFFLLRRGWNWGTFGFVLLAALSPGPIYLTNRLWGHALIPPLSIATFLLLVRGLEKPAAKWPWFWLPLCIAIAQQVHFSGALLLVNTFVAMLVYRRVPAWKHLAAGTAIAAASYSPFLIHEFRTGFADFRTVANTIAGRAATPHHIMFWRAALHSLSDFGGATAFQENYPNFLARLPLFVGVKYFLMLVAVGSFAGAIWQWLRRDPNSRELQISVLAIIWVIVPLMIFSMLSVTTVPAYWLIALPGPWLIAAGATQHFADRGTTVRIALGVIGCAAAIAFFNYSWAHYRVIAAADPMLKYPSYRDQRDAISFICSDSKGRTAQLDQVGADGAIDYQLLYLIAMKEGDTTRLRHGPGEAKYLKHYLVSTDPSELVSLDGWNSRQFGFLRVYVQPEQQVTTSSQTN